MWQAWHLATSTFTLCGSLPTSSVIWHGTPLETWSFTSHAILVHTTLLHPLLSHTVLPHHSFSHSTFTHDSFTHTHHFYTSRLYTHFFHQQHFYTELDSFTHLTSTCISCTHRSSTISFLFPAFPIPSSPFFGYFLEEVDKWGSAGPLIFYIFVGPTVS